MPETPVPDRPSPGSLDEARFIVETGQAATLAGLVEPALVGLGFRLVRVTVSGRDGKTVQIMAERPDGTISIDDCERISKQLSPLFDAHDAIPGSYRLEISSPGIDRPLVRASDFEAWAGYEAKMELAQPVSGKRRFRGLITGFEAGEVRMRIMVEGDGEVELGFPVALVADAKLVLTDELIRDALSRAKRTGRAGLDETGGLGDGSEPPGSLIEAAQVKKIKRKFGSKGKAPAKPTAPKSHGEITEKD